MADEINFDGGPIEMGDTSGLTADDFNVGKFLKNPEKGQRLLLDIIKVSKSDKTTATNKTTGKEFNVGLKQKNGQVKRYDIECVDGTYTVSNWEIYFKLFGPDGLLMKYAKQHNGQFAGAKVEITRLVDGGHANYKASDLALILKISPAEAEKYIESVKLAIKEQRLFSVALVGD